MKGIDKLALAKLKILQKRHPALIYQGFEIKNSTEGKLQIAFKFYFQTKVNFTPNFLSPHLIANITKIAKIANYPSFQLKKKSPPKKSPQKKSPTGELAYTLLSNTFYNKKNKNETKYAKNSKNREINAKIEENRAKSTENREKITKFEENRTKNAENREKITKFEENRTKSTENRTKYAENCEINTKSDGEIAYLPLTTTLTLDDECAETLRKEFTSPKFVDSECHFWLQMIGITEGISYWKASCSKLYLLENIKLGQEHEAYFLKLFKNGLGEFFYRNGFDPQNPPLPKIRSVSSVAKAIDLKVSHKTSISQNTPTKNANDKIYDTSCPVQSCPVPSCLVPIGGGKDSSLALDLLVERDYDCAAFLLNEDAAARRICQAVRKKRKKRKKRKTQIPAILFERKIDKKILLLNANDYFNGHTPFSALLACYASLAAKLTGRRHVVLANEASANESSVKDSKVNHQYSKSTEFERDFRKLTQGLAIDYFSFLRPWRELRICAEFAKRKHLAKVFRSCNVGLKEDRWCLRCGKCVFVALMLSPFLSEAEMREIFSKNPLNLAENVDDFLALLGETDVKPWDCVGTIEECCLACALSILRKKELPKLLRDYKLKYDISHFQKIACAEKRILAASGTHYLPKEFWQVLKELDGKNHAV